MYSFWVGLLLLLVQLLRDLLGFPSVQQLLLSLSAAAGGGRPLGYLWPAQMLPPASTWLWSVLEAACGDKDQSQAVLTCRS